MELFIQVRDGQPCEHPILGDNFRQAFPDIDTNNLPSEFARFIRISRPPLGPYEKNQTLTYEWVGDVVQDVWHSQQMTAEEKQAKIDLVMAKQPFSSWIFDEPSCSWKPPIPYPTDGKHYRWDESITNWVEVTLNQGA